MCIIVHKPKDKKLDEKIYEECFWSHKDGGGFAFIQDHELVVRKGFMEFKEMYKAIQGVEHEEMLIHFRTASPGMDIGPEMCHPFLLKHKNGVDFYAIAHNGRLDYTSTKEKSDTAHFVEEFISPLLDKNPDFFQDWKFKLMLEKTIGYTNKMVVFRYNSVDHCFWISILNKRQGEEAHECWFSNSSFRRLFPVNGPMGNYHNKLLGGMEWDFQTKSYKKKPHIPISPVVIPPATGFSEVKEKKGKSNEFILAHLSKPHRKLIRRMAAQHLKSIKMDMTGMDDMDKIEWYRLDLRETYPITNDLGDDDLDKWAVEKVLSGNYLDPDCSKLKKDADDEEREEIAGVVNLGDWPAHD